MIGQVGADGGAAANFEAFAQPNPHVKPAQQRGALDREPFVRVEAVAHAHEQAELRTLDAGIVIAAIGGPVGRQAADGAARQGIARNRQRGAPDRPEIADHRVDDFVHPVFELGEHRNLGVGRAMRGADRGIEHGGLRAAIGLGMGIAEAGPDDAAFAELADRAEGQAAAVGAVGGAVFGARGGAPQARAIACAQRDRGEVFAQDPAFAEIAAARDRMIGVDNLARIEPAEHAVAIERGIDRQP